MTEQIITIVSMLAILTVPTFLFMLIGEYDEPFNHTWSFTFLGFLLFIPTFYALRAPITLLNNDDMINCVTGDACVVAGEVIVMLVAFGVVVYWIDYKAGVAMHKLWHQNT